jgi:hypothetical protein
MNSCKNQVLEVEFGLVRFTIASKRTENFLHLDLMNKIKCFPQAANYRLITWQNLERIKGY